MSGIMRELYYECIGSPYANQEEFLRTFFDWVEGLNQPAPISGFINTDFIPKASKKRFEEYNKKFSERKNEIMQLIRDALPNGIYDKAMNEKVIGIAISVTQYGRVRDADERKEADFVEYDADERKRLITYLTLTRDNFNLAYNIYLLLSFAVSKQLPPDFTFGANYKEYLEQFNREVTCMHGTTTFPGIARIIALSESKDPNMFCILSYADLLYYGQQYGIRKNLAKCYKYFRIAAGLDGLEHNDASRSFCHPLALFSTAFLLRKYQDTDESNTEEYVEAIQKMSITERYAEAAKCAMGSFILSESAASANTLGQIAEKTEEEVPGIEEIKRRFQIMDADYYYNYAAKLGYVYATNNLAMKEFRLAFQETENSKEHFDKYIKYLRKSGEKFDPWALNRLGEVYRTGELARRVAGKEEVISFKDIVDERKAYNYYLQAIEKFSNVDSAWAYVHLIINYPDKFADNEIKLKRYINIALSLNNKSAADYLKGHFNEVYNRDLSDFS